MREKLSHIQSLRGFAALLVVCYHAKTMLNETFGHNWGDLFFNKGAFGVEIFFIISGFIMVYTSQSIENKTFKFSASIDFILKRLIRIAPLYYFLTLLFVVLSNKISQYFFSVFKFDLITSLLFYPYTRFPVLLVGWSLNFEMFFYIVFAISLFCQKRRNQLLALMFIPLLIYRYSSTGSSSLYWMLTNPIIDYFAVGVILGIFYHKILISDGLRNLLALLASIVLFLFLVNIITTNNHFIQMIIVSFFAITIILLDFNKKQSKLPRLTIFLGDISYSIYLTHLFIVIIMNKLIDKFQISHNFGVMFFLSTIVITIVISKITNKWFENLISNKIYNFIFNTK